MRDSFNLFLSFSLCFSFGNSAAEEGNDWVKSWTALSLSLSSSSPQTASKLSSPSTGGDGHAAVPAISFSLLSKNIHK